MKLAHLNLGLHFARPYESDYALLRRCLISNPGMPVSAIEAQLRQQLPTLATTYQRLRALQQAALPDHPYQALNFKNTHRRQCPQCAEQLYHCDLYALPWLSHCPLHQCALTDHCPRCQHPWPDKTEYAYRDGCPVCGIPSSIEGLPRSLSDKNCSGFDTIRAIYELIALSPGNANFSMRSPGGRWQEKTWWKEATPDTPYYPALKAQLDLKQYRPLFKALGIPVHRLKHRSSRLIPTPPEEQPYEDFYVPPKARPDPLLRRAAIDQTMSHIVSWIGHQSGHAGELHILSYRYLYTWNLMREPPPCPYCMAFSLWFFQVNSELYDEYTMNLLHHYPFLNELRMTQLFTGIDPDVTTVDADNLLTSSRYHTDDKFVRWFLQRGLELAFAQMLYYAFSLVMQFDLTRVPPSCTSELVGPLPRTWEDQWYLAYVRDGRLYFYYENEHPLERLEPPKLPGLTGLCLNYCQHRKKIAHDNYATEFAPIPLPTLTPELCLSLHNNFERYLVNMYRHPVQF